MTESELMASATNNTVIWYDLIGWPKSGTIQSIVRRTDRDGLTVFDVETIVGGYCGGFLASDFFFTRLECLKDLLSRIKFNPKATVDDRERLLVLVQELFKEIANEEHASRDPDLFRADLANLGDKVWYCDERGTEPRYGSIVAIEKTCGRSDRVDVVFNIRPSNGPVFSCRAGFLYPTKLACLRALRKREDGILTDLKAGCERQAGRIASLDRTIDLELRNIR